MIRNCPSTTNVSHVTRFRAKFVVSADSASFWKATKMTEQTIVTDFFSAAKSRQSFQPAKRRKIALDDGGLLQNGSKAIFDASCVKATFKRTPSKTKQTKRSRARNTKNNTTRKNAVAEESIAESVSSEVTSMKDDHELEKPRKQRVNIPTNIASSQKEAQEMNEKETKDSAGAPEPCSEDNPSVDSSTKLNIVTQQRSGLKIHPWISDQAKIVLATRGRRALEKSLGQNQSKDGGSKKSIRKPEAVEKKAILTPKRTVVSPKPKVPRLHQGISAASHNVSSSKEESASAKLPAYKRFSHLLEAKPPKPASTVTRNLPLPYDFKMLEEIFRCVDIVLSLKQKRYETCTFDKLKNSVQEMCRKKFEKKHLAQMKTVYPMAFTLRQESGCYGEKRSEFQLTVDFKSDESSAGGQKKKDCKFIESSMLIARQKHFKKELLKITMDHHRDYLTKNHPSMTVDDDAIVRWHPCFRLDEVPEISPAPLPEATQAKTYNTAQDVLDKARQNMTPRVEKSLSLVAQKSKESSAESKKDLQSTQHPEPKIKNSSLKGVSQSLIQKIRQKEEKKIQESLIVDENLLQKRAMVQRFPELCRILKTYFISERKAAIPLEDACNKLAESYTASLSSVQVEKHLTLLSELVPEWLSIIYVRKCPYIKLKKSVNINNLIEKLKSKELN